MEIELLVRPRSSFVPRLRKDGWDQAVSPHLGESASVTRNRGILHRAIAWHLTMGGVTTITHTGNYTAWTVADEPSLDEYEGLCKSKSFE